MTKTVVQLDGIVAGDDPVVDQVGGNMYQYVKLTDGTVDSETSIEAGAGTATGALRTTLASDDPAVALLGTIDTDTGVIAGAVYTEDVATANPQVGTATLIERDDALTTVTPVEGDWIGLRGTAEGALWTQDFNSDQMRADLTTIAAAVGGTHTDDDPFTAGSSDGVPIFAAFDDTTPDSVDEGDAGVLRMSANRNLYNTIRDAAGNERGANVNAGGQLEVASSGGATSAATAFDSYGQVAINLTTGANQVLVSSAASKQIWVYGYTFTCGDADGQTVSFQDEDDTALSGIMEFSQYGGAAIAPSGNFEMPIWKLATDKDLEIDITGGDVDGWLSYAIVSV